MMPPPVARAAAVTAAKAGRRNRPRSIIGVVGATLDPDEGGEQDHADGQQAEDERAGPALAALGQTGQQRAGAHRQQHHARVRRDARGGTTSTRDSRVAPNASATPATTRMAYTSRQECQRPSQVDRMRADRDPGAHARAPPAGRVERARAGRGTRPRSSRARRRRPPLRPIPSTMRASTNTSTSGVSVATTDPTASTSEPATKVRRRPKSSATRPAVSRNAPRPMLIELRIQVRPETPAPRPAAVWLMVGQRCGERHQHGEGAQRGAEEGTTGVVHDGSIWSGDRTQNTVAYSLVTRPTAFRARPGRRTRCPSAPTTRGRTARSRGRSRWWVSGGRC